MTYSPRHIGFLQAMGLAGYIGVFATTAFRIQTWAQGQNISPHPIVGIMLFLLAFVISALISTSLILAYPIMLFFNGRRHDSLKIILWSAVWLIIIFLLVGIGTLLIR